MVRITFDTRERALVEAFRGLRAEGLVDAKHVPMPETVAQLALGDVMLQPDAEQEGPCILVERKRHDDLMNSLFDGRLDEQTSRLEHWRSEDPDQRWVVLLIEEGGGCRATTTREVRHFLKVLLQRTLEARLVLRTLSLRETALLLLTLH